MKPILMSIVLILSLLVMMGGHIYWRHKINMTTREAKLTLSKTAPSHITTAVTIQASQSSKKVNNKTNALAHHETIKELTTNLPQALQTAIQKHYTHHLPFKMVLVGGSEIATLAQRLQLSLNKAYGSSFFQITEANMGNKTSLDIYHHRMLDSYLKDQPNAIIYTPPFINDMGVVNVRDSLDVIRLLREDVKKHDPNALFIVQPPNPAVGVAPLIKDVTKLDQFMNQRGYLFINHMKSWPTHRDALKKDLNTRGRRPNEAGDTLWVNALTHYFTSQQTS